MCSITKYHELKLKGYQETMDLGIYFHEEYNVILNQFKVQSKSIAGEFRGPSLQVIRKYNVCQVKCIFLKTHILLWRKY